MYENVSEEHEWRALCRAPLACLLLLLRSTPNVNSYRHTNRTNVTHAQAKHIYNIYKHTYATYTHTQTHTQTLQHKQTGRAGASRVRELLGCAARACCRCAAYIVHVGTSSPPANTHIFVELLFFFDYFIPSTFWFWCLVWLVWRARAPVK